MEEFLNTMCLCKYCITVYKNVAQNSYSFAECRSTLLELPPPLSSCGEERKEAHFSPTISSSSSSFFFPPTDPTWSQTSGNSRRGVPIDFGEWMDGKKFLILLCWKKWALCPVPTYNSRPLLHSKLLYYVV